MTDLGAQITEIERSVRSIVGPVNIRRPTNSGLVQMSRVCFVKSAGHQRLRYVLSDGSAVEGPGYLKALERQLELYPAFVRTALDYMVNLDRVVRIARDRQRGYLLSFEGTTERAVLSKEVDATGVASYVEAAKEYLELPTLDHVSPFNDEARALRELEIASFPNYPRDDLRFQSADFYKTHFYDSGGRFVLAKFVRTVLWQNYVWIREGKRGPFNAVIRSVWYSHIKPVLMKLGLENPAVDQSEVVGDTLKQLVVEYGLFAYWDIGIQPGEEVLTLLGDKFPHVVFFTEKRGLFHVARQAHKRWGVTVVALGGSPSQILSAYLVRDLMAHADIRPKLHHLIPQEALPKTDSQPRPPLTLFGYTDYDPKGTIAIAQAFRNQLQGAGATISSLYQICEPVNFTAEELALYRVPLRPQSPTAKALMRSWVKRGYGIVEGNQVYGIIADSMESGRVLEVFEREARHLLEPLTPPRRVASKTRSSSPRILKSISKRN